MSHKFLDAVSSTGKSEKYNADSGIKNHTFQIIVTGAPTAVELEFLGSLNDDHYCEISTKSLTAEELTHTGALVYCAGCLVNQVKVNLKTLTGGTNPTVTVLYHGEGVSQ